MTNYLEVCDVLDVVLLLRSNSLYANILSEGKNMAQKIIYGTVSDDGTKQTGAGFKVESPEAGIYLITFLEPFVEPPSVVATLKDWGADNQIIVKEITTEKCKVAIWDLGIKQQSGTASPELVVTQEKSAFNFIAIGEGS
ncbi:hypothetical protein [Trichormus sp. NMC-1]|uniref:hypothetical protein n=1 Tax=Trichormus sp. NMC-1 TaxID=1853259 RepID=UPI000AEA69E9|nr:hypothetical protein [Trichormus sp. NMC-1]